MSKIAFLLSLLPNALSFFKVNPRKAAHIVVVAVGYITVAIEIIEQVVLPVLYQAKLLLQQVLDAIGPLGN